MLRMIEEFNGKRITTYRPLIYGQKKIAEKVYEFGNNKRLVVDSVIINKQKQTQVKTLSRYGEVLKRIIIEFVNGKRNKVIRER